MNTLTKISAAAVFTTLLNGCVIVAGDHDSDSRWQQHQKENSLKINNLQLKANRSAVMQQMGTPDFSDAYMKGDDAYHVVYYRTQHLHSDGETTKDETTPLVFKNDLLIGWGEKVLAGLELSH